MQKLFKIPLLFLVIASWLGVFLRWQIVSPVNGVNYTYILHAHSHVMFLGWVCNVLFLAFIRNHIETNQQRVFINLFIVLQVLIVGMLISFPLQGYGLYSIMFSSLHTFGMILFVILFFQRCRKKNEASYWYARVALIFFMLSSVGPFALGYSMAVASTHRNWYYFSIYYYLHFQYNGFFTFGIFSLFFKLLESRHIPFNRTNAVTFGRLMAFACVPAYFLSILWAQPGIVFTIVAGAAACMQVYALVNLVMSLRSSYAALHTSFTSMSRWVFGIVLFCFAVKLLLQCASFIPAIAEMAYQLRPVVIAYLHLVLVGIITLFIFIWYRENDYLNRRYDTPVLLLCVTAFAGMEILLVLMPWWSWIESCLYYPSSYYILVFSIMLAVSFLMIYWKALK
jgi:hypothetical protein